MRAGILLMFVLLLLLQEVCAQRLLMQNYNMRDGLSHSNVYRIFQDRKGFMWFSTDYGLSSFNGRSFTDYSSDSLLGNTIMSVAEDDSGNKIVSTFNKGIVLLSNTPAAKYPLDNPASLMHTLYAVRHGRSLWVIGQDSGQHLYRIDGAKAHQLGVRDSSGKLVFFHTLLKTQHELLFSSTRGIYRVTGDSVQPFLQDIVRGNVKVIRQATEGSYWIGLEDRVIQVNNGRVSYTYLLKKGELLSGVYCDRHNNTWVSLYGSGLIRISNGEARDIGPLLNISPVVINDIVEDSEGQIWLATYGAGVYKITSTSIINYPLLENKMNTYCNALYPIDSNRLLIGTIGRVGIWDRGTITPLNFDSLKQDAYVYFVYYDDRRIYVGTSAGLLVKDLRHSGSEHFVSGINTGVLCMLKRNKNTFVCGSYKNIFVVNNTSVTDTFASAMQGRRINVIFRDHSGSIWLGTTRGVVKYDGRSYTNFPFAEERALQITHHIIEDSHNRIWVATEGGLICISGDGQYKVFKTGNGLNHNRCTKLVEDGRNTLWVATLHGLNYIDLRTLIVQSSGVAVYPDEIMSLYYDGHNTLFIGTANGLVSIKTDQVSLNNQPPPTYIISATVSGRSVKMSTVIALKHNETRLTIDFIGVSMVDASAIEYRYRILNLDNNWHITSNNSLELQSLPAGSYTFVLNARKNKGPWGGDAKLEITVAAPFWKTWWFNALAIALFALTIFYLAQRRTRRQESKKRVQAALYNKIVYLKQQALSALINPHFIFNCMSSIQDYLHKHDTYAANDYLADFARLIRITMEDAQHAFITLEKELERIRLYLSLEQLRFGDNLTYEVRVEQSIETNAVLIPNMILQPYIENAVWHGIMPHNGVGHIQIDFSRSGESIAITITDNGVGIDHSRQAVKEEQGTHFGMRLTDERLQLLQKLSGQYYTVKVEQIDNANGATGTRVTIIVPNDPADILEYEGAVG